MNRYQVLLKIDKLYTVMADDWTITEDGGLRFSNKGNMCPLRVAGGAWVLVMRIEK